MITVPIVVTLVGMVTDVSDVQLKNVMSLIEVTLEGMVTDVNDEHSAKAPLPI